jgi:hypothetical protein
VTMMSYAPKARDAAREGVVGRQTAGGWGHYHRMDCALAPRMGDGVGKVVHGPWRYLAAHWDPCPVCAPPGALGSTFAA